MNWRSWKKQMRNNKSKLNWNKRSLLKPSRATEKYNRSSNLPKPCLISKRRSLNPPLKTKRACCSRFLSYVNLKCNTQAVRRHMRRRWTNSRKIWSRRLKMLKRWPRNRPRSCRKLLQNKRRRLMSAEHSGMRTSKWWKSCSRIPTSRPTKPRTRSSWARSPSVGFHNSKRRTINAQERFQRWTWRFPRATSSWTRWCWNSENSSICTLATSLMKDTPK